jgi:hypothetical protein
MNTLEETRELGRVVLEIEMVVECPDCERYHYVGDDIDLDSLSEHYDTEALVEFVREEGPFRPDAGDGSSWDLSYWAKAREVQIVKSFSCLACSTQIDINETPPVEMWRCPAGCGSIYASSHDALLCCSDCDVADQDFCLGGVDLGNLHSPGIKRCNCSASCTFSVCTECHTQWWIVSDAQEHWDGHHADNEDMEAEQVGRPASLPPAVEYKTVSGVPGCPICESDFCCLIHGAHKNPHRGVHPDTAV